MLPFGLRRLLGVAVLSTGLVCPCHALLGLVGLVTGGTLLSPAAQDGVHAAYVPGAILGGAMLLRRRSKLSAVEAPRAR